MSTGGFAQPEWSPCIPVTAASLARLGLLHRHRLPVDPLPVELPHSGLGGVFVRQGDESVALTGVVDIGDLSESAVDKSVLLSSQLKQ